MLPEIEAIVVKIEAGQSLSELKEILQNVAESCGYSAFSFVDAPRFGDAHPTVINTIKKGFDSDYRSEGLIAVDPMIPVMRRKNTPFTWGSVKLPARLVGRMPGAHRTMTVATDHGYREGLVIPVHYVDRLGRPYSSVVTFFWTDNVRSFARASDATRAFLHLIVLYWCQRAAEMIDQQRKRDGRVRRIEPQDTPTLTDREREVLAWAAAGKTVQDTADILSISNDTAETHIRSAIKKLNANNKTHAVARAIFLGLIDN
ncbi:LuxR C-terminal-related transcriptional regulator [Aquabacter cavernae]|uniref:LuxR C-terminal-related transcriptional regulator n=1 Tax=Aquabacter cavernae TaxID=2496029 RepID=UPI000F8EB692|nr:LuxR C-terminal-related transcriptional regulator [Aquabacter cavernae]